MSGVSMRDLFRSRRAGITSLEKPQGRSNATTGRGAKKGIQMRKEDVCMTARKGLSLS